MSAQVRCSAGLDDLHSSAPPWEQSHHGMTTFGTISGMQSVEPLHNACASRPVASQGLLSCQGIIDCGTAGESGAWAISADVLSAFPKLQHDRYEDSDSESGSSDSGTASEDVASWISWFCSLKGNEFFCEVCWPRMLLAVLPLPAVCSQPIGLLRDLPGMQLDLVGRSLLRSQLSCIRPAGRGGLYSG